MPEDQTVSPAKRVQVHTQLGLVRARQNKFDLAIVQLQEALKLNPEQPAVLNTLAWTLATCPNQSLRDPPKALELARQACALTRFKNPQYLNTLAVAYSTLNNFGEAVKISERALAIAQAKGDQKLAVNLQKQLDLFKRALADSK
jgi:tetratricopeptide (TPR) repeat protein